MYSLYKADSSCGQSARWSYVWLRLGCNYMYDTECDDDGTVLDEPVTVRLDITVKGNTLTLDFSRSDKQRKGFVNCVYASTYSRAVAGSFIGA